MNAFTEIRKLIEQRHPGEATVRNCGNCHRCLANVVENINGNAIPVVMLRMVLCVTCGNKRCPHATDCLLPCTNSNEPGQKGSIWENYKVPA